MNIVVFDNSQGACYKKTRRHLTKILVNITDRKYVGNLPSRIINDLLANMQKMVSKNSDVLILVEKKNGFHGWIGYHFGKSKEKEKYVDFLIAADYNDRYIKS